MDNFSNVVWLAEMRVPRVDGARSLRGARALAPGRAGARDQSEADPRDVDRGAAREVERLYRLLAERLEEIVRRQVRVQGDLTVIEDACQTAWAQFIRHRRGVCQKPEAALAWLVTTARREALRLLRARHRDCALTAIAGGVPEATGEEVHGAIADGAHGAIADRARGIHGIGRDGVAELIEQRELLRFLHALPPRQRRLLLLRAVGYSYQEIAHRTGESVRSVERQLLRARREARRLAA